jgi:hypothetical protein
MRRAETGSRGTRTTGARNLRTGRELQQTGQIGRGRIGDVLLVEQRGLRDRIGERLRPALRGDYNGDNTAGDATAAPVSAEAESEDGEDGKEEAAACACTTSGRLAKASNAARAIGDSMG